MTVKVITTAGKKNTYASDEEGVCDILSDWFIHAINKLQGTNSVRPINSARIVQSIAYTMRDLSCYTELEHIAEMKIPSTI